MAWDEEFQEVESVVGDVGEIVGKGLGIYSQIKSTFFPAESVSAPPSAAKSAPEPIAAKKAVSSGASVSSSDSMLIVFGLAVVYFLFLKK